MKDKPKVVRSSLFLFIINMWHPKQIVHMSFAVQVITLCERIMDISSTVDRVAIVQVLCLLLCLWSRLRQDGSSDRYAGNFLTPEDKEQIEAIEQWEPWQKVYSPAVCQTAKLCLKVTPVAKKPAKYASPKCHLLLYIPSNFYCNDMACFPW